MKNAIQINNSFNWDAEIQTEDFIHSLGDQVTLESIPNSELAIVRTDMTYGEFKALASEYGLSLGFITHEYR